MTRRTFQFPSLIHVRRDDGNGEPFLVVEEDGVATLNEHGERIAIYRLVDDGHVEVARRFVSRRRATRRSR